MNRNVLLSYLCSVLGHFRMFDEFIGELSQLIVGSGIERKFFTILSARLRELSMRGAQAVELHEFESIGDGLFSMHLSGREFNIRVLYSFLPNREPVLLLPFYERTGKNKTDYTPYIEPARSRLISMKEEYYNEK